MQLRSHRNHGTQIWFVGTAGRKDTEQQNVPRRQRNQPDNGSQEDQHRHQDHGSQNDMGNPDQKDLESLAKVGRRAQEREEKEEKVRMVLNKSTNSIGGTQVGSQMMTQRSESAHQLRRMPRKSTAWIFG